jgi:murein DD-endopeptidase MepM/ murein hydrolase activator NlpD
LERSLKLHLDRAQQLARHHRRKLVAAIVVGLGGFGVTAFGIAPLMPDASEIPQRWVTEAVQTDDISAQITALSDQDLSLWQGGVSRGGETAESLLRRLGVNDPRAAAFIRSDETARRMLQGRGKMLQARTADDGSLLELVARYPAETSELAKTHFSRMTVSRVGSGWNVKVEQARLEAQIRMSSGVIRSSLFAATDEARLPDAVALQIAEIFATDIDFHRELRKGDTFSVVYEALSADGEPVSWNEGTGRVLAAEFVNNRRPHHALLFEGAANERPAYYGLDGMSRRRAFLASPMEFSRVTSGFASRFHPILRTWRKHLGVDYAAPIGTPVRSVGDGIVDFAGWQNGYGKVIEIRHSNERTTLYAHLNDMAVRKGERVSQGQHIGAVGVTGWTTGPHLHFEFRVAGEHQDPLILAKASEQQQLDPNARASFAQRAQTLQAKLDIAESLVGVRIRAE